MGSWEDLYNNIRRVEESLWKLRLDDRHAEPADVLRDPLSGWYTREYLTHRLPAEAARSDATGRSFATLLLRVGEESLGLRSKWRRVFAAVLDPMDVAVRFSADTLFFLIPEAGEAKARARLAAAVDATVVGGLCPGAAIESSWAVYPKDASTPGTLVQALEKRVGALTEGAKDPQDERQPEVFQSEPPDVSGVPVAVGFADERSLPVSFWYGGELNRIEAVLEQEVSDNGGTTIHVSTENGPFYLTESVGRWFAKPAPASA